MLTTITRGAVRNMTQDEVARIVFASIADVTGRPPGDIRHNDTLLNDLRMDGDDFTFVFLPTVEKALGVKTDPKAWAEVSTVRHAIDVFMLALAAQKK